MFDQINDPDFSQLRRIIESILLNGGMAPGMLVSKGYSLPEGYGFIKQITLPLRDMVPALPDADPDLMDLFGADMEAGPFAEDLMAKSMKGLMPVYRQSRVPSAVRIIVKNTLPCGDIYGGYFPLHNPVHQLLSLLYAAAQRVPDDIMYTVQDTAAATFGPRTVKTIIDNVVKKPVEMVTALPDRDRTKDPLPAVATFMPALLHDLVKLNFIMKGKLDPVLKDATEKFRNGAYLTVRDREFQKKIYDALLPLEGTVTELNKKPAVNIVYNSDISASEPEIINVKGFLVDLAKVRDMGYRQACVSLSKQVADYIYDEAKENVVPEQFIEMIEKLSDLSDIPPEDRKELDDRILGPIRSFFSPEENTVDKLMDKNSYGNTL